MKSRCNTCSFFSLFPMLHQGKYAIGQCRFTAPSVMAKEDGSPKTVWPVVRDSDFCGEHAVDAEEADG